MRAWTRSETPATAVRSPNRLTTESTARGARRDLIRRRRCHIHHAIVREKNKCCSISSIRIVGYTPVDLTRNTARRRNDITSYR